MSVRADDAVVDMLVAILSAKMPAALAALYADASVSALTVSSFGRSTPAPIVGSVVVGRCKSSRSDEQAANVGAPLRREGTAEVRCNVAATHPELDRARRLWAQAAESVLLEWWQTVASNTAGLWSLTTEIDDEPPSEESHMGAAPLPNIKPIAVIVTYRQHVTQTVRLA